MVRQDLLDRIVWSEVVRLLEDPTLIQRELDRRLAAARSSDPARKREQGLQRELTRVGKGMERLLNAYQEMGWTRPPFGDEGPSSKAMGPPGPNGIDVPKWSFDTTT
jgi:hypothetical protein